MAVTCAPLNFIASIETFQYSRYDTYRYNIGTHSDSETTFVDYNGQFPRQVINSGHSHSSNAITVLNTTLPQNRSQKDQRKSLQLSIYNLIGPVISSLQCPVFTPRVISRNWFPSTRNRSPNDRVGIVPNALLL